MYDSRIDNQKHINEVIKQGTIFCLKLQKRFQKHDASKLVSPEKEGFDKYTHLLKAMKFGSDEYNKCLEEMKSTTLKHHYKNNSHHPEHFENGISGMTLYDLIEMWIDWNAAVKRSKDGNINNSIDFCCKRFKINDQLKSIFLNTAEEDS